MQYILYTFPASHYCEKTRWNLDFKGLDYQEVGWVPLLHFLKVKRLPVPKTSVPIVQVEGKYIQDSTEIFRWLEKHHPEPSLMPQSKADQKELWEINQEMERLGVYVRRWIYAHVLPFACDAKNILSEQANPWQAKAFQYTYPVMKALLIRGLGLQEDRVKRSEEKIYQGLESLSKRLKKKPDFLLGNQFSFADITVASLLSPLVNPPEHPVYGKVTLSQEVLRQLEDFQAYPILSWVSKMYREKRT